MPQYEPILVPHPIQPKTQDEVRALADQVIDQIITKLLKQKVQQAAYGHFCCSTCARAPTLVGEGALSVLSFLLRIL